MDKIPIYLNRVFRGAAESWYFTFTENGDESLAWSDERFKSGREVAGRVRELLRNTGFTFHDWYSNKRAKTDTGSIHRGYVTRDQIQLMQSRFMGIGAASGEAPQVVEAPGYWSYIA